MARDLRFITVLPIVTIDALGILKKLTRNKLLSKVLWKSTEVAMLFKPTWTNSGFSAFPCLN